MDMRHSIIMSTLMHMRKHTREYTCRAASGSAMTCVSLMASALFSTGMRQDTRATCTGERGRVHACECCLHSAKHRLGMHAQMLVLGAVACVHWCICTPQHHLVCVYEKVCPGASWELVADAHLQHHHSTTSRHHSSPTSRHHEHIRCAYLKERHSLDRQGIMSTCNFQ